MAVATGEADVAFGTDTAGSGRVPAGFANIVGLKPSLGLVSTAGLVPACRTLDCVSVFSLTVDDAMTMLDVIAGADAADPYSRPRPVGAVGPMPAGVKLGVPLPGERLFFGDKMSAEGYEAALERLTALGAPIVEIDIEPFYEAARLLYEGPWVAERYLVAKALDEQQDLFEWSMGNFSYNRYRVAKVGDVPLHPGAARYYRERGYLN